MKTRQLGSSGQEVGEVGLGCWQFGGDWGPMEEDTAFAIMEAAVERGVDFFDTADVYGAGRSETLIGRFLRGTERPVTVATKFGRDAEVFPDKYSESKLRRSVEGSLSRLGVGTLDLLQLHCVPTEVIRDGEIFDQLRRLQDEGLIRHFGASVETVEEGLLCLEQEGILSLQVIFNIFRQKPTTELLPQAKARGVALVIRLPLASGLLAGKMTQQSTFAETDHRHYNRDGERFSPGETFAGLPFAKGVELAERVKKLVPEGMSMSQMALRWILDHEEASVLIPGASSPEQARSNAGASAVEPLPEELHERLKALYLSDVHSHIRGPY